MNPILSTLESKEPGDYTIKSKQARLQDAVLNLLISKGMQTEDPLEGNDHTALVLDALSKFIRYNTVL